MDWTMIGAVGEILGALGVIVTLAYLAKQIRHSTVAVRQEAFRETMDLQDRFLSQIGGDPQVANVFRRGLEGDPSLDADERMQLRSLFLQLAQLWQRQYRYARDLRIPSNEMASFDRIRADLLGAPGFQEYFEDRGHWFDSDFQEWIRSIIAESEPYRFSGRPGEDAAAGGPRSAPPPGRPSGAPPA